MFLEFRRIFKETGARGWQIDRDEQGFYLSKFDDNLNDDQFRFYLTEHRDGSVDIAEGIRRKSTGKVKRLKKNHSSLSQASIIVSRFNEKKTIFHKTS
jgi:hypothetical protein